MLVGEESISLSEVMNVSPPLYTMYRCINLLGVLGLENVGM